MKLKKNLHFVIFSVTFATWLVSLLAIYSPMSESVTSTFPARTDDSALAVFLVSTVLASTISFLIGLDKLGTLSYIKKMIGHRPRESPDQP